MKKFSKVLVFVLAFISFATVQSKAQKGANIQYCGTVHNQAMEDVYSQLLVASADKSKMGNVAYQTCVSSLSTQLGISASTIEGYYAKIELAKDFSNYQNNADLMKKKLEAISDEQLKGAYYELLSLVDKANSYENLVSGTNNLKKRFVGTPNEVTFGAVVEITISSYQYWTKNLQKWIALSGKNTEIITTGANSRVAGVVKDDLLGAVGGAYSGAVTGPGGALAGAMIFGVCSSAVSAFFLIW